MADRAVAFHLGGLRDLLVGQREAALLQRQLQRVAERPLHVAKRHAVLRPLGARQARLDRRQIEVQHLGIVRLRAAGRRAASERKSCCSFVYRSTSSTSSSVRPVSRR